MDELARLAELFERMGHALEILGENRFRVQAHLRAARAAAELEPGVLELARTDPDAAKRRLLEVPGIGKGLADKIVEFARTGSIAEIDEVLSELPPGLFDLLDVPGLGPKAVRAMWRQLGIDSIEALERAIRSPRFAELPRMGPRSIERIARALEFRRRAASRTPLGIALPLALELVDRLASTEGVDRAVYAGSLRRGVETVGDLDLLVAAGDSEAVTDVFVALPGVTEVLARGRTRSSVRLESGHGPIQVDLRVVDRSVFGAAWLYFTGSKEHSVALRERAAARGCHLNEYGLFPGTEDRPQDRGVEPIAAATEEEIYAALDLPFIPPELREEWVDLEHPPSGLITAGDLRAELHAHTVASDGVMTIEELAAAAKARGFHTVAVTDHSRSSTVANGLDAERLVDHVRQVRAADRKVRGVRLLAGSEVDILPDGSLDYDDDLLAQLDIVVASPHASLAQDPERATRRLVRAASHPLVDILGHPTGRLIGRREGLAPDIDAVARAAAANDTALEINANWMRLDLRDLHVRAALAAGCVLALDTDAHAADQFDQIRFGVLTARRGGLPADRCINTWSRRRLDAWLARRRRR